MRVATVGLNEAKSILARVEAEAPVVVQEAVEGFAYSKCDPERPEIYSPRHEAVERIAEGDAEIAEIIGTGNLHEALHLRCTMCKTKTEQKKINDRFSDIAIENGTGSVNVHQLHNVLEDPRIERIGCEFLPGKERDFTNLITIMHDKNDGFRWQESRNCMAVTGQYLLLYSRCKYSKASCLTEEVDKGAKAMTYYYTPEEIKKIQEIANKAIMTGHFGDGENYQNGMKVLDSVEEIIKMINSAQKRYDEEGDSQPKDEDDQSGNGEDQSEDGQNRNGQNGESQQQDDTKPGQIKGSPQQGTGKVLTEIDTDLYRQIRDSIGKQIREIYKKACREVDTENEAEKKIEQRQRAERNKSSDTLARRIKSDWIPEYSSGAECLKRRLIEDGMRSTIYQTGRLDSKRIARTYTASMSGHRYNGFVSERKGTSPGHDITIVIDASGSMIETYDRMCKAEIAIRASYTIYKICREVPKVSCRMTCYDDSIYEIARAGEHITLRQAAERYAGWSGTYTGNAVNEAGSEILERSGKEKLLIVVTDGEATDTGETHEALAAAARKGIKVVVIYIDAPGMSKRYTEAEGIEIKAADLEDKLLTLVGRAI